MPAWEQINGSVLNQGDLLTPVAVPIVGEGFPEPDETGNVPFAIEDQTVIVVSQSCDLEQGKIDFVVVASVFTLEEFETANENYRQKGKWLQVANGRVEALHLLFGPGREGAPRACLVIDFRRIAALPVPYLTSVADRSGRRWRLQSPYLENMSQAFGRFFMRVALPNDLPRDGY